MHDIELISCTPPCCVVLVLFVLLLFLWGYLLDKLQPPLLSSNLIIFLSFLFLKIYNSLTLFIYFKSLSLLLYIEIGEVNMYLKKNVRI